MKKLILSLAFILFLPVVYFLAIDINLFIGGTNFGSTQSYLSFMLALIMGTSISMLFGFEVIAPAKAPHFKRALLPVILIFLTVGLFCTFAIVGISNKFLELKICALAVLAGTIMSFFQIIIATIKNLK